MAIGNITARWKVHKDILIRGAGFAAATAAVCGALAVGTVLRDPSRSLSPASAEAAAQDEKDQTRVGSRTAPTAEAGALRKEHGGSASSPDSAAEPAQSGSGEWRDQEFTFVTVVDGRTFSSGAVTVRLAGIELPPADQVCRTLDNRLEPCAARAATQLELLTRSRTLACRYQMTTSSEALGSCRIGSRDLAERMARTGYVRAAATGAAVMAKADGIEAAPR